MQNTNDSFPARPLASGLAPERITRRTRDLTKCQFDAATARRGFTQTGVFGYFRHPDLAGLHLPPVCNADWSVNRRATLAYLIQQLNKHGVKG